MIGKSFSPYKWIGTSFAASLIAFVLFVMPSPPITHAFCSASITVTNTNDNGAGSLRDAVSKVCSGGTIGFSVTGTINLTSTLTIPITMTITGPTQGITVSGNNSVRVFGVFGIETLNLSNLTIANGSSAGGSGLYNSGGTVNITSVTFVSNTAPGSGLGGGIANLPTSTVTISNSTFVHNSANQGGAINNDGRIIILNSTFYSNTALAGGSPAHGGGIENFGTVAITNSTFAGNSSELAGAALDNASGGTLTIKNTIVANSLAGGSCYNAVTGTITDGGNNLQWPSTDTSCPGTFAFGDPKLAPLGNYGGSTKTMGLFIGSAAIEAVPSGCPPPSTDQRGIARPQGAKCDIGAFEGTLYPLYLPLIMR